MVETTDLPIGACKATGENRSEDVTSFAPQETPVPRPPRKARRQVGTMKGLDDKPLDCHEQIIKQHRRELTDAGPFAAMPRLTSRRQPVALGFHCYGLDMTEPSHSLERASVATLLARYSRADRASLFDELVDTLSGLMRGVRVERTLLRRRVLSMHVPVGDFVYALARDGHDVVQATRQHVVRGVAVRTSPLELGPFLEELGAAMEVELRRTEAGAAALEHWMRTTDVD